MAKFEVIGYYKDVFFEGKFYGGINLPEKDRETIGYYGRRKETTTEPIKFKGKKTIPAGSEIETILYPLNGKQID